ncbi:addiction module toxin RelE [Candidatus Pacearchaeota archaeon CG10_big_fil_rev_8_21_14_0_10_34_76]|nr:MAG: addiction module toxin RelE [Candidatus Pacearchaeota archaeon CG10_big_fil_rev_8_21_14_0_10_34_76]
MYPYKISDNLKRILKKISRKDKRLYENILSKIEEVSKSESVEHYKNLRYDLKEYKRVHVGSFVLVFRYEKKENLIFFEDFDHHDKIYKR